MGFELSSDRIFEVPRPGVTTTVNVARLIGVAGTSSIVVTAGHTILEIAGSAAASVGMSDGFNAAADATARAADVAVADAHADVNTTDTAGVSNANSSATGGLSRPFVDDAGTTFSVVVAITSATVASGSAVLTIITQV